MGCHALLQGIFPAQGSNPLLFHLTYIGRQVTTGATWEAQHTFYGASKNLLKWFIVHLTAVKWTQVSNLKLFLDSVSLRRQGGKTQFLRLPRGKCD